MMVRLALLALVVYLAYRLVGGWRRISDARAKAPRIEPAQKCPKCGAYVVAGTTSHVCNS
jgi:hypothetical protein